MLAGKPGDRKSSIIDLAEMVAHRIVPESAFLPKSFSPETLFEEFSEADGGRPDKLWIVDDANAVLTDWRKAVNGERVATRFLELYDCKGISDHFRRNGDGKEGRRRSIPETSTSLLFGATFNIASGTTLYFASGDTRTFDAASTISGTGTLQCGAGTNTVSDLMTFFQDGMGIFSQGANPDQVPDDLNAATPQPGVSIETIAGSTYLTLTGNLGAENKLDIPANSFFDTTGALPFTFQDGQNAAGITSAPVGESVHTSFVAYDSLASTTSGQRSATPGQRSATPADEPLRAESRRA